MDGATDEDDEEEEEEEVDCDESNAGSSKKRTCHTMPKTKKRNDRQKRDWIMRQGTDKPAR